MKRLQFLLLIILALSVVGFAGCKGNVKKPDTDYVVTFDKNGGTDGFDKTEMYVNEGGKLLEPGHVDYPGITHGEVTRPGYLLDGWYTGTKADDGTVTFGQKWNFATDVVNSSFTLYAKWVRKLSFKTYYVDENGLSAEQTPMTAYTEEGKAFRYVDPTSWKGHTFLGYTNEQGLRVNGYYLDQQCTQPVLFDANHYAINLSHPGSSNDDEGVEVPVYAKFITGTYTLVTKGSDLLALNAGSSYYLLNDVDCSVEKDGQTVPMEIEGLFDFSGQIIGNGHKISNLSVSYLQPTRFYTAFGMFGKLTGSSQIKDVTFVNCSVTVRLIYDLSQGYNIGFLAGEMSAESKIENVGIQSCKVTVYKTANLTSEPTIRQSGVARGEATQIVGVTGEATVEIKDEAND